MNISSCHRQHPYCIAATNSNSNSIIINIIINIHFSFNICPIPPQDIIIQPTPHCSLIHILYHSIFQPSIPIAETKLMNESNDNIHAITNNPPLPIAISMPSTDSACTVFCRTICFDRMRFERFTSIISRAGSDGRRSHSFVTMVHCGMRQCINTCNYMRGDR